MKGICHELNEEYESWTCHKLNEKHRRSTSHLSVTRDYHRNLSRTQWEIQKVNKWCTCYELSEDCCKSMNYVQVPNSIRTIGDWWTCHELIAKCRRSTSPVQVMKTIRTIGDQWVIFKSRVTIEGIEFVTCSHVWITHSARNIGHQRVIDMSRTDWVIYMSRVTIEDIEFVTRGHVWHAWSGKRG